MPSSNPISLPRDLVSQALTRFDAIHAEGKLNYEPSTPTKITHNDFVFSFSMPLALATKPLLPPSDPSRSKPGGPFLHPDPDFTLCAVGATHILELNKHCILRPMYILHTKEYEKQADDLGVEDIETLWAVLGALDTQDEGEGAMAIYNCGTEAGASQGHKHVQLFPKPDPSFTLYPYQLSLTTSAISTHPTVPYVHAILAIPEDASAQDVFAIHEKLLAEIQPLMKREGMVDYNVIIVKEWMLLIPRRHHGREGVECNAVGMMGMVWLRGEADREGWERLGLTEHLKYLGFPRERAELATI